MPFLDSSMISKVLRWNIAIIPGIFPLTIPITGVFLSISPSVRHPDILYRLCRVLLQQKMFTYGSSFLVTFKIFERVLDRELFIEIKCSVE